MLLIASVGLSMSYLTINRTISDEYTTHDSSFVHHTWLSYTTRDFRCVCGTRYGNQLRQSTSMYTCVCFVFLMYIVCIWGMFPVIMVMYFPLKLESNDFSLWPSVQISNHLWPAKHRRWVKLYISRILMPRRTIWHYSLIISLFWVVKSSKIGILPAKNNQIELRYLKNYMTVS